MDSIEGKNQVQIILEEILLKYAKDLYTLQEMEQLLSIFEVLYYNLIRRMGQLVAHHQNSMARGEGKAEYSATSTSEFVRYLVLQEVISKPVSELEKSFSTLIMNSTPLLINDYAFGKGSAINALLVTLSKDGNITKDIRTKLMDVKNPEILLTQTPKLAKKEGVTTFTRDLREPTDDDFKCTLGIIGYVYFYLHMEDFFKSILYRLKECDFLTILPAGSDYGTDISVMIIGKVNGEYKATISTRDENFLMSRYYALH
ncbi:MAG: hypothetical protein ABIM99_00055 [Candidatus Dojkabacteria bacterium]